jgi:predicted nucleotidyltransferase
MTNAKSADRNSRLPTVHEHGRVESASPPAPLSQAEVCRRLRQLVGTHGIERFILFGSFARGTQTWDSDVDLIVITSSTRRFLDRYPELLPLLHRALRPHAVEPLIYTEAEYEALRCQGTGVVCTAHAEGVIIHV